MALAPDYPKETLTIGAIYNAFKGTMALIIQGNLQWHLDLIIQRNIGT